MTLGKSPLLSPWRKIGCFVCFTTPVQWVRSNVDQLCMTSLVIYYGRNLINREQDRGWNLVWETHRAVKVRRKLGRWSGTTSCTDLNCCPNYIILLGSWQVKFWKSLRIDLTRCLWAPVLMLTTLMVVFSFSLTGNCDHWTCEETLVLPFL